MQDVNWHDLKHVLALHRAGGFAGAARLLMVNESTVARRVSRLEETLGAKIIERAKAQVFLTEIGRDLAELAEQMEAAVEGSTAAIAGRDQQVSGKVRITAVPVLINHAIGPQLPVYLTGHPELSVDLIAAANDMSLMRREVDLAIRLARPRDELRAIARKIGSLPYAVLYHRDREAEELPWLNYSDEMRFQPQVTWMKDLAGPAEVSPLRVNDAETLLHLVRAGVGRALLPVFLTRCFSELAVQGDQQHRWEREVWLLTHPDIRNLASIKVTGDWLADLMAGLRTAVP